MANIHASVHNVDTLAELNALQSTKPFAFCVETNSFYAWNGTVWTRFLSETAVTNTILDAIEALPSGSEAFPVGSVFIAVVNTNPATLLGYGIWATFGAGKNVGWP